MARDDLVMAKSQIHFTQAGLLIFLVKYIETDYNYNSFILELEVM